MQRTEPNVISVVYSDDTDATKEQIIAKVKVRADSSISTHSHAGLPALSPPRIKAANGGPFVATIHSPWAEPRLHVPCMGGHVEVYPGPLHW